MMLVYFVGLLIGIYATMSIIALAKLSAYDVLGRAIVFSIIFSILAPVLVFVYWQIHTKDIFIDAPKIRLATRIKVLALYNAYFFKHYPSMIEGCVRILPAHLSKEKTRQALNDSTKEWASAFA